jgi:FhuF 2Fe-2S C-terminal domain
MEAEQGVGAERDPADGAWTRRADQRSVTAALAQAATLGDYFTISTNVTTGPWRPASDVYADGMGDLVAYTARQLRADESRVAVSIAQLGYAARLWSPGLSCILRDGIVPDLSGLQIGAELPLRLRLLPPRGWHSPEPSVLAGLLYRTVVVEHLEPLAARLEARIASRLLWGNAASAMTGALGVIVRASPDLAGPARGLADLLLSTGSLRGTGGFTGPGLDFRRRSCCLYYRVPEGGMCGDCSLL